MLTSSIQLFLWAGFLQSLVLSALLLTRSVNWIANLYLAGLLVTFSLQGLFIAYGDDHFYQAYPHLSRISWVLPFLFGPLFYLYVRKLIQTYQTQSWKKSLHFIPSGAYLLYLSPYLLRTAQEKRAILSSPAYVGEVFYWDELKVAQSLVYLISCFLLLKQHRQAIKQTFSNTEHIRLEWLSYFIYFLLVIWVISFLTVQFSILPVFVGFEPGILVYIVASAGLYLMAYVGMNQPLIFNPDASLSMPIAAHLATQAYITPKQEEIVLIEKYSRSALRQTQIETYCALLSSFMTQQKPYLQNDLTIEELSASLKIPKHHL